MFFLLCFMIAKKIMVMVNYYFISKFKQDFLISLLALVQHRGKNWSRGVIYHSTNTDCRFNILTCLLPACNVPAAILKQAEFSLQLSLCPSNLFLFLLPVLATPHPRGCPLPKLVQTGAQGTSNSTSLFTLFQNN